MNEVCTFRKQSLSPGVGEGQIECRVGEKSEFEEGTWSDKIPKIKLEKIVSLELK